MSVEVTGGTGRAWLSEFSLLIIENCEPFQQGCSLGLEVPGLLGSRGWQLRDVEETTATVITLYRLCLGVILVENSSCFQPWTNLTHSRPFLIMSPFQVPPAGNTTTSPHRIYPHICLHEHAFQGGFVPVQGQQLSDTAVAMSGGSLPRQFSALTYFVTSHLE